MNVLGICSGVGGLELGIHASEPGSRCIAHVEREAYAAAVLVSRMADGSLDEAPIWTDLGTFDGRPWRGVVDLVTSGDPCQPNSVAGRGLGADDDRWLIGQVLRIIEEVRPSRVFRENVTGNADGQLGALVGPLERLGYRVAAGIFSAAEVGASHRRERLFIMADRADGHGRRGVNGTQAGNGSLDMGDAGRCLDRGKPQDPGWGSIGGVAVDGTGGTGDDMGDTEDQRHQRTREPRGRRAGPADDGGCVADGIGTGLEIGQQPVNARGTLRDEGTAVEPVCLPLFAPGPNDPRWPAILRDSPHLEPAIRRVADRLANRVDRLRACGNGVVPLAAAYAYRTLAAHFDGQWAGEPVLENNAQSAFYPLTCRT